MDGQALYEAYAAFQLQYNNCHVDEWATLETNEQAAWQHIAEMVNERMMDAIAAAKED